MASSTGAARQVAGHNRIPIASDRNPESAHARIRKELNDIRYPGTLTSRLKRYAAEPAPDRANLTPIHERTANAARESASKRQMPERDDLSSKSHPALSSCLRVISRQTIAFVPREDRYPPFRMMF